MSDQIDTNQVPCGCGRSATGFCTGLHELSDQEWKGMLMEEWNLPLPDEEDDPL
jgi:hypothetical protein